MSNYDFDEKPAKRTGGLKLNQWDILSIVVLLITVCIGGYYALIFINPNVPFNPLPPPPTPYQLPTATITPIQLQPTWTPTNAPFMTATDTPPATFTMIPTMTSFSLVPPTNTPPPTATPKAPFSESSLAYASTVIPHLTDLGCAWQGVGGSVDDASGSPIVGMVIRLVGTYNGNPINLTTVSGVSPDYGKSGFEFTLGTTPVNSTKQLYVQLLDQAGLPLADNLYINTYSDCNKNLILVHFKKR
ncbi:MAG TPA: hypothetical protein VIN60_06620 [Anaerolineales bacterium]